MTIEDQVFTAISYKAITLAKVAQKMGMTRQNLRQRLIRNSLKKEDLIKIAEILGGKYVSFFVFPEGVLIGDRVKRKKKTSPSGGAYSSSP